VKIRNAPKMYITKWKFASSAAPMAMKMPARDERADDPQNSTRCCSCGGTAKYEKATRKTNRLSTESAFSISQAWKNSSARSEPLCR
jgi:hypothetical protein